MLYWEPKAIAVAQVVTVQVTAFDVTTTYTINIGGVEVSVLGVTDADATAAALSTALNDSAHPYFTAITWSVLTDTVTGTADLAGLPFAATSSVAGGAGTIGVITETVAATGPNFWNDPDNWSTGAIPVSTDDVAFRDSAIPVMHGLVQTAVALDTLTVEASYTGKIGLRSDQLAVSADGLNTDTTVPEYRPTYLDIGWTDCDLGGHNGPGRPSGSSRIRLDNANTGTSETRVHSTATSGDGDKPAVLLLFAAANADLEVRSASGGVGIAAGVPLETSTIGDVTVTDATSGSSVFIGDGVTMTNYTQRGGLNRMSSAGDITTVTVLGGDLDIRGGDYTISNLTVRGGLVRDSHRNSGGNEWTTVNLQGGTLNLSDSSLVRTVGTFVADLGVLIARWDLLTLTVFTEPTRLRQMTFATPGA